MAATLDYSNAPSLGAMPFLFHNSRCFPLLKKEHVMGIVTLSDSSGADVTSLQIPAQQPGFLDVDTSIYLTVSERTQVSLAINGPNAGAFVAVLYFSKTGVKGPIYNQVATSAGGGMPGTPLEPGTAYNLHINFTAPTSPAPQYLTATLVVTWPGGQQTVALVATTAQITVTTVMTPAIPTGGSGVVGLQIEYASLDYSTLDCEIALESAPPGITMKTVSHSLPVAFVHTTNPKTGISLTIPSWYRSATVYVPVHATISAQTGSKPLSIQVSTTDSGLSQLNPNPDAVPFIVIA
jgi:hypothetical protein